MVEANIHLQFILLALGIMLGLLIWGVVLLSRIHAMVRAHIFKERLKIYDEVKKELDFLRPHFEKEMRDRNGDKGKP